MNKAQIAAVEAAIKSDYEDKINALIEERDFLLAAISQRKEMLYGSAKSAPNVSNDKKPTRHAKSAHKVEEILISVPKRMKAALERIEGEFSRQKLFEMTRNDGNASPIAEGTLAVQFAKLVKSNEITTVQRSHSNIPGLYRKTADFQISKDEQPPMVRTVFPTLEEKGGSI